MQLKFQDKVRRFHALPIFLAIKLTILLLIVYCPHLNAQNSSPRINLNEKNIPLEKALSLIEQQSGYDLFYKYNEIEKAARVTVDLRNASIQEALEQVIKNQPFGFVIKDKTIIVTKNHKKTPPVKISGVISGKVTDKEGVPLAGVSIRVKNSTEGTITDANGDFQLTLSRAVVLLVSYVGYQSKEIIADTNKLTIILEQDSSTLSEVVVLGYGQKQTKISTTGAVSSIRTKELKQSPAANLTNALAGRLPGLITAQRSGRPGSDASNLYIRGISTYSGNSSPLVVIDGLPRGDANFGDIDPNEVESVTILKDASSTALYGIQGANGIVLITTKRGAESAPNIQLNTQFTLQQPTRRTRFLDSYTAGVLQNEAAANDGLAPVYSANELQWYKDQTNPYLYPNVDWFDYLIKDHTPQNQTNVNISGGSKHVKYFVSGSYLHQEPIYRHANENMYGVKYKYDRYNFRSNVDVTLSENMDLQIDLASRLENRTGPSNDRTDQNFFFILLSQIGNNVTPVFNPDGSIAIGRLPNEYNNPYAVLTQNGYFNDFYHSTNGNLAVTRKLDFVAKGLKVKGLFSFENYGNLAFSQNQQFDSFRYIENSDTGEGIYNRYTTKTSLNRQGDTNGQRYHYYDLKLLYDREFGKNSFSGVFLFNRNYRSQFADLPRVYQGFVGRIAYNYQRKYFLEFNAGYNGSENFPPGRRYGFFPAVSAGWLISDEEFMPSVEPLSLLKLRFSHGYVGNDQIGSGRWLFISNFAPSGGYTFGSTPSGVEGYIENRVGNTAITWERAAKTNLGIETGFFKDRLLLTVDLFRELRSNILTTALTLPDYIGISAAINRNKGEVLNRGIETELSFNSSWDNMNFFTKLNYTYTKNKILDMDEPKLAYPYQSNVGLPIGYGLGYIAEGLFQSQEEIDNSAKQPFSNKLIPGDIKYKDINDDKVINDEDRVMIPMLNIPNSVFGLAVGFGYKNFDISMLFQGALGGSQIYSAQLTNALRLGYRPHHLGRWTPENANSATFPALHLQESNAANNALTSTYWVESTDYVKLKNLEIGYRLSPRWVKAVGLKNARLFFNGLNLVSWDGLKELGIDPESNTGGRYGWQPYPIQRLYNAGLTVNF